MKKVISEKFDVVVVGAGPAGMMAAIRAAEKGARVALVEKKDRAGIKLLMTGNGRCNLTQDENDALKLSGEYGRNGKFLLHSFGMFGPEKVRNFFSKNGLETKVEKNGRVFPKSDQSKDVLDVLIKILKENGVTFLYKSDTIGFDRVDNEIAGLNLKKRKIIAKNYILATGGKSYPSTGSIGVGYEWAQNLGHKIIQLKPILTPIKVKEEWAEELQGVSASSVSLSFFQNNKKKFSEIGDLMFAHYGLSGPLALDASREIAHVILRETKNPVNKKQDDTNSGILHSVQDDNNIKLVIDFKPYLNFEKLDEIIRRDLEKKGSMKLKNCFGDLFSPKLLDFLLKRSGLDLEKHAAKISRKERQKLVALFKGLEVNAESLFGFDKAMVTGGGISVREIDSKTMQSKIIKNLFFAGEIVDVDGPTGGYNLQICWSTGYVAGENAA